MHHLGHRHAGFGQRALDPELAIDRMGGRQQLARRLLAQDQVTIPKAQPVGRVRLAPADRCHGHRATQLRQAGSEIAGEPVLVELRHPASPQVTGVSRGLPAKWAAMLSSIKRPMAARVSSDALP